MKLFEGFFKNSELKSDFIHIKRAINVASFLGLN